MNRSKTTTDHDEIRRWAEARRGKPAAVKGTSRRKDDIGMIRIDFPGYSGEGKLQPISWDRWFEKFDESNLAMILQEETAKGQKSNFNKLIARESLERDDDGKGVHVNKAKSRRARQRSGAASSRATSSGRGSKSGAGSRTAKLSASGRGSSARAAKSRTAASGRASNSRTAASGRAAKSRTAASGRASQSRKRTTRARG
ncbi:MAG TPA: hypothetical protein VGD37_05950 [Kofleriaceae bacterium]|jgi:hypothetical protein